jgi:peptide/nickel transport system permease protein
MPIPTAMLIYVARRLAVAVLLLVAASFLIFAMLHVAPGSPIELLAGGRKLPASTEHALIEKYKLDDSFFVQYFTWLGNAVHGDFGDSISLKQSVSSLVSSRAPITLELGLLSSLFAITFGVVAGTLAAVRRGRPADAFISGSVVGLSAVPTYLSGTLLILVFAVSLDWFPVFGPGSGGAADRVYHLVLPTLALGLSLCAFIARVTRGTMVRILQDEYVEAARVRGFSEWRVVGRHAMRNALGPIVTASGLVAGYLITGAVLVEVVFGLNGLGALLVQGVVGKDFAVVQAIAILFTAVFIVVNLVVDVLYLMIDPRTTVSRAGE